MKRIIAFVKSIFRFILWVIFALPELWDKNNADDYNQMIALFVSLGAAAVFVPIITFFSSPTDFKIVVKICLGIYFIVGLLFCWFLEAQYDYNFLKNI